MLSTPPAFTLSQDQTLHKWSFWTWLLLYYFTNYKIITHCLDKFLCFTISILFMYIFYINIYSYFTSVINNRFLQEFYIRFTKITLQTFIIIFKDHPTHSQRSLIILSSDALQSNWTGIIIDSSPFVKSLELKFSLISWIYTTPAFLLAFYWGFGKLLCFWEVSV